MPDSKENRFWRAMALVAVACIVIGLLLVVVGSLMDNKVIGYAGLILFAVFAAGRRGIMYKIVDTRTPKKEA